MLAVLHRGFLFGALPALLLASACASSVSGNAPLRDEGSGDAGPGGLQEVVAEALVEPALSDPVTTANEEPPALDAGPAEDAVTVPAGGRRFRRRPGWW